MTNNASLYGESAGGVRRPNTGDNMFGSALVHPHLATNNSASGGITVLRAGATNAPLNVNHTIAGTAANRANYPPLTGSVTIPANSISGTIMVTPIANNSLAGDETVILYLSESTNYTPGRFTNATVTPDAPPLEEYLSASGLLSRRGRAGSTKACIHCLTGQNRGA